MPQIARLLVAGTVLVALAGPARAASSPSPSTGVAFNDAQVAEGREAYAKSCALCHGANLEGAASVALSGATFAKTWGDGHHNSRDYFYIVAQQMPKNTPGTLSERTNLALMAYILSKNGYPAGSEPLIVARLNSTLPPVPGAPVASSTEPRALSVAEHHAKYPQPPAKVAKASGRAPDDRELLAPQSGDWLTFNRNLAGDRYSPLAQITTQNAKHLQVKCLLQLGELGSFETSPIAYQGKLYVTTAHKVAAVDGATCAQLWSYTYVPVDPEHLPGNRGVALYRGKVFRGTTDGHLIALDAASGKLLWDVRVADGALGYEITGAPMAFDGKVVTGDAGADVGINGRVYAFDADTGAVVWTFDMVPRPGEATETWSGSTEHGGGSTWSSMAIDPARRLLFVPIGNPAPDFNDKDRLGTNLYTDSVVALDLDSGKIAWHVQQVPHDLHDWDTAAAPALFDVEGRSYMAVASKNGLLYIYDRNTHATLFELPFATRENVDVPITEKGVHVCPGALGQYNGPAYSPKLRAIFLAAADRCNVVQRGEARYVAGSVYFGGRFIMDPPDKHSGWIRAFDPVSGKELWSMHRSAPLLAAVTPTAGGVVLTGDVAGEFLALDAKTGSVLYRFQTGGPIAAGISTYLAGGRQYVAVPSGSSSRDAASATAAATLVVFALQ